MSATTSGTIAPPSLDKILSAYDRCDRCGAQAYVRATLASGGELLFCAHHSREHTLNLVAQGAHIYSESEKLIPVPTPAAAD